MSEFYKNPSAEKKLKDCKEIVGVWLNPSSKLTFIVWKNHSDVTMGRYLSGSSFGHGKIFDGWVLEMREEERELVHSTDPIWFSTNSGIVVTKSVGCHCTTFDITWIGHNNDCSEKKRR